MIEPQKDIQPAFCTNEELSQLVKGLKPQAGFQAGAWSSIIMQPRLIKTERDKKSWQTARKGLQDFGIDPERIKPDP